MPSTKVQLSDKRTTRAPNADEQKTVSNIKRYNLGLPTDLFDQIQQIADTEGITMLELLRKFIKLGLIAYQLSKQPDSELIIRQGNKEREIVLL